MSAIATNEAPIIAQAKVDEAALAGTATESAWDAARSTSTPSKTLAQRLTMKLPRPIFIRFVECRARFPGQPSPSPSSSFVNFIQQPLPEGSTTGAGKSGQSGALGMGQRASTGLVTFNQFWAYVMPLLGAYMADAHWGRYKTIHAAIICAMVGHVILTASAAPSVIQNGSSALGAFTIGLIILGVGTGGFKSNISPLLAEQQTDTKKRIEVLPSGERVIVDPTVTTSRIFLYFYLCINIGSLVGQIGMVYAEKYVGFWLAYMLPTVLFLFAPVVLALCRKRYVLTPPTGSVFAKFWKLWAYATKGRWSINPVRTYKNFSAPDFWERVKPSRIPAAERPAWMTFDDAWVEEVRRGLKACAVFLYLPLYWLAYGQMTGNLTSQAAVMELNGVPNDIIQNLNPISIIIFIPLMDFVIYPALRKARINFTPIKRIAFGFALASLAMVAACVIQVYIYRMSPCGHRASDPDCSGPAPINVWVQTVPYVLIGFSEIMASITSLEYAFTKAPYNMRSFVMSINLLMNAFSSAIAQGLVALSADPLLVWNYGLVAVLAGVGGVCFWFNFKKLDSEEDKLNMLQASSYTGKRKSVASRGGSVAGSGTQEMYAQKSEA
ncbi:POT family proton-dependent oligopeptide transporter [Cladophialophora yegresii CBS 114405]|uniref:POT family proton-dependent oligopeptide transporter n=1 Tax=Cladophialophora yegresii CBS 114405 TaxID=1182544 RepID=W9W8L2_9EURO|nr:POT family proton-dependent oligopeptide transporter [Cladophialophora yegresii CBS 114405]EXJ64447.1 POT family proton-dependent oligopeptide transporter [Cladophialophora yegresii CBS 114405]